MKEVQEKLLPGELGVSPRFLLLVPKRGGQGVEGRSSAATTGSGPPGRIRGNDRKGGLCSAPGQVQASGGDDVSHHL